jgi:hypothetical protein
VLNSKIDSIDQSYRMTREEYNALYEKYLSGNCTSKEREAIENYQDSIDLDRHHWIKDQMGEQELVKETIHSELLNSIAKTETQANERQNLVCCSSGNTSNPVFRTCISTT